MSNKNEKIEWGYARRSALNREVRSAIYALPRKDKIETRCFVEEAKKKLPALYRSIENHNANAYKVNTAERNRLNYGKLATDAQNIAMFGTEKECQALADKWLLKPLRK